MSRRPQHLVIPAAGLGTRMRKVCGTTPKEMLPVGNRPAIHYAIEEGVSVGVKHFIIILNHNKEVIREYIEKPNFAEEKFPEIAARLEEIRDKVFFTFLYQDSPKGEMDAIALSEKIINPDDSLIIIYPDNIYTPSPGSVKTLLAAFEYLNSDVIALIPLKSKDNSKGNAGQVDLLHVEKNLYKIVEFHKKGQGQFVPRFKVELKACGMAIYKPGFFDFLKEARLKIKLEEFTDYPVRKLILKKRGIYGVKLSGVMFDVGSLNGYQNCLNYLKKS